MAKTIIRLNEQELHHLISESVERYMISEGLLSDENGKGFLSRTWGKTMAGMEAGDELSDNRFDSVLRDVHNKWSKNKINGKQDDSLRGYAKRRGYKGYQRLGKQDEKDFEEFMKQRGYRK